MSDELDGIFDNLTPQDFEIEAEHIQKTPQGFDEFVDEQVRSVQTAYLAAEGQLNAVAVIANDKFQQLFAAYDDETMGQFIERLHNEALKMGGVWVFLSRPTQVASHLVNPEDNHDVADRSVIADAAGILRPGLIWYAECREGNEQARRIGIFFDEDGRLVRPHEVTNQRIELFEKILQ